MSGYVITGPPCSGKTTHIQCNAGVRDLVIDLDRLAHALGYRAEQIDWSDRPQPPSVTVAIKLRRRLIATTLEARPDWTTWIIDTSPSALDLERYRRAGFEIVSLDPGRDECERRARNCGRASALPEIARWYMK